MSRHVSMDPNTFFVLHHHLHRAGHVTGTVTRLKWLSEHTVNRPVGDSIQFTVARSSLIYSCAWRPFIQLLRLKRIGVPEVTLKYETPVTSFVTVTLKVRSISYWHKMSTIRQRNNYVERENAVFEGRINLTIIQLITAFNHSYRLFGM
jgi:hypothetical protein